MINFNAFEEAHKKYTTAEMPFLSELRNKVIKNKPYQGLKILHNIPLTIEAVLKIETLILGGAEVTASCITLLDPNPDAIKILQNANVDVQIEHLFQGEYDFHLDCCAELLAAPNPRIGAIELTQTGSELYKNANPSYPAMSIDDSDLKLLETIFGTGDGFVRALKATDNWDLYDKKFTIFGYGKVGRGIAHSLMKLTDRIMVIDIDDGAMHAAKKRGIKYIDGTDINKVKKEIQDSDFIVTASGIKGILTNFYHLKKSDCGNSILANMGAYDEFGDNFTESEILFNKKPLNFSIQEPTTMKYLDPILYAHNIAIDLILTKKMTSGYHSFPNYLAKEILEKWGSCHKENFFDIEKYFY
jgi:adenosylhomocysteinase